MAAVSAGLLVYRRFGGSFQVLLAHPGGPFFAKKDLGAWTIPKGELNAGEDLLAAARREFLEETGVPAAGPFLLLTPIKQKGGKVVHAWAMEGEIDVMKLQSNTFTMQWPPRSGREMSFPEIDRAAYFDLATAREKMNPAQVAWLNELQQILSKSS